MTSFVIHRLVTYFLPVIFGVSIIIFAVVRLIPGDAVDVMNARMPLEQQEMIRELYGLDRPIWVQYVRWIGQVAEGNLGVSLRSGRPVLHEIGLVAMPTLELGVFGALIGIAIGVPAGIVSALYQNKPTDSVVRAATYVGISIPEFWLGGILILTLGIGLNLFPVSGYVSFLDDPARGFATTFMPALALGLVMAGFLSRVTRSTMLDVNPGDKMTTETVG